MENTNKKERPQVDTKDWHRISICDVRHPAVAILERDIEQTSGIYRRAVHRAKQDRYALLATLPQREYWDKMQQEAISLLEAVIDDIRERHHKAVTEMYADIRRLTLVNQLEVNNIIPTAGRAVIARWLTGDNTYSGDDGANYGSLGTSSTAPANGDTQLTTETYRKATSSVGRSNNIAYLSNFYTATEVTGTFEEAGWHISGTGTVNTGQLLSHFLTTTLAKTSVETLTVESTLTIS